MIPYKFYNKLGLVDSDLPLWERLLSFACQKISALGSDNFSNISYLRPLCKIIKAFNFSTQGIDNGFSTGFRTVLSLYKNQMTIPSFHNYLLLSTIKVCVIQTIKLGKWILPLWFFGHNAVFNQGLWWIQPWGFVCNHDNCASTSSESKWYLQMSWYWELDAGLFNPISEGHTSLLFLGKEEWAIDKARTYKRSLYFNQ
jgi:hypothetical protein